MPKEYFAESLKREDYYSEGQEISGDWHGIGAQNVGIVRGGDNGGL